MLIIVYALAFRGPWHLHFSTFFCSPNLPIPFNNLFLSWRQGQARTAATKGVPKSQRYPERILNGKSKAWARYHVERSKVYTLIKATPKSGQPRQSVPQQKLNTASSPSPEGQVMLGMLRSPKETPREKKTSPSYLNTSSRFSGVGQGSAILVFERTVYACVCVANRNGQ